MGKNDRKARERDALALKRRNRKIQKSALVDKKVTDLKRLKRLKAFTVQLGCGCCDEEVFFASDAEIAAEFAALGLTVSGTLVDQTGREVCGIDTFYGYRTADQPRRGLDFLINRILKP